MVEPVLKFGPFELFPVQRQLLADGQPVRLGSRALDILIVLTRHAGEVLTKDQLIAAVWPGITVEEANLRVNIAALRKVLGDGVHGRRFIASITGRGYSFVAQIAESRPGLDPTPPQPAPAEPPPGTGSLPLPLTRVLGRADVVRALVTQLPQRRLVTIVGAGGIGKTTVALTVAESLAPCCRDGAVFVDLARVEDPLLVPTAVAAALHCAPRGNSVMQSLQSTLRDRALLLVLDSCEHVVDAVTALAETLLKAAPGLLILATSREPLRAEGEWVQRLGPLGLPPAGAVLTPAEALRFPAVQLFVERASSSLGGFELCETDVQAVTEICLRLDGIALAIELAAGRLDAFGLRELATRLDDRFRVLTRGRRTAVARHQALRATLDWSYGLLTEVEQGVMRRLSVFRGDFTLGDGRAVGASGDLDPAELGDVVACLVEKSLAMVEFGGAEPRYRLFETVREYASERLRAAGEQQETLRRHADHIRQVFEHAETDKPSRPSADWLADYSRRIDDLRAALRWAFLPQGDQETALALTVASVPLWLQLSLVDECLAWVSRALDLLEPADDAPISRRRRMKLHAASGWAQMYAADRVESGIAAWRMTLQLADELGDGDYQSRALWALWADRMNRADFRGGLELAERFQSLFTDTGGVEHLVGERMLGTALHFLGRQPEAQRRIETMLRHYDTARTQTDIVRFQFDQRITARMTHARILWVQGHVEQALRCGEENIRHAASLGHTLSICNTLAQSACPVALLAGELEMAQRYVELLRRHVDVNGLDVWRCYADGFEGEIAIRRGNREKGLHLLTRAVEALRRARFIQHLSGFQLGLARGLQEAGQDTEALAEVDDALARVEACGDGWALPELLRRRAEILLGRGPGNEAAAEHLLRQSLDVAREQQAASWELRTAVTLGEMLHRRDSVGEAADLLEAAMKRFTEGFSSADFARSQDLARALQAARR